MTSTTGHTDHTADPSEVMSARPPERSMVASVDTDAATVLPALPIGSVVLSPIPAGIGVGFQLRFHAEGPMLDHVKHMLVVNAAAAVRYWTRPIAELEAIAQEQARRGFTLHAVVTPTADSGQVFVFVNADDPEDAVALSGRLVAADFVLRNSDPKVIQQG